ncbi:LLM class flavin-dependent oxidoreductase [Marinactinospora rubrisoli]|uniref:LLM class flavin-dependent oxidoreductase n=1 Tax=Marinactinospora rubrisoli TaxID=2715399 RepID=A0ABW2KK14_9ACTN
MTGSPRALHLAAAIDGAGAHPAAWRAAGTSTRRLCTADHYVRLALEAERGRLDFVTLDDALAPATGSAGSPRARLDAVLTLARVAPLTSGIGLVPTVTTTHTEPFHVSKAVATLDYVSAGRAGWRFAVSGTAAEARHIGRRGLAAPEELWAEAAAVADVVARLWDSWEDDAEIRDTASGRFIDREKLHYVDFTGPGWTVKGPSITPRPPQGHPLVVARADSAPALRAAARHADVIVIAAAGLADARSGRAEVRTAVAAAGRAPDEVAVLADTTVLLAADPPTARERRTRLDELAGPAAPRLDFVGTPADLADRIARWAAADAADGFLIRPAVLPTDLTAFVDEVVPRLRDQGLFRPEYTADTLRGHFGLPRPANRYASA